MYIPDEVIDKLLAEDVPYIDLTTWVLGIGLCRGEIAYFTREDAVLCGTEEVLRIMARLHLDVGLSLPSGSDIKAGEVFLRARGRAEDLHMAWKVCQNIFDHCSGIATKTRQMIQLAQEVNPRIAIVTTRKGFPGTKALSIKAVMVGGAFPHRLGLSETVLVFQQHLNFMGGLEGFIAALPKIKHHVCEKKLIVEANSVEDGIKLCRAGVDGLQFDKLSPEVLCAAVPQLKAINPQLVLLAAGGITEKNLAEYAQTGVDGLVTTSLYSAKPIDIGVKITALE
ncbi:ModD protein [Candidatus Formimonas warabiya]|uniref:Putative pyrophosphorylase ModD n=2 Tax=Formimonas warabiya TaxID=1761012 RepID=A0A3G1L1D4_FORW1|nr:ModD protein [Candidatus Formimonas warabiya]